MRRDLTPQDLHEKELGFEISICEHRLENGGKSAMSMSCVPLYDFGVDGSRKRVGFWAARDGTMKA